MTHKTKRKAVEKLNRPDGLLVIAEEAIRAFCNTAKELTDGYIAHHGDDPLLLFATFHGMRFNPNNLVDCVRASSANGWTEEQYVKKTHDLMTNGFVPFALITLSPVDQFDDKVTFRIEHRIICGWNWSPEKIKMMVTAAVDNVDTKPKVVGAN